jgi:hypothetical protein
VRETLCFATHNCVVLMIQPGHPRESNSPTVEFRVTSENGDSTRSCEYSGIPGHVGSEHSGIPGHVGERMRVNWENVVLNAEKLVRFAQGPEVCHTSVAMRPHRAVLGSGVARELVVARAPALALDHTESLHFAASGSFLARSPLRDSASLRGWVRTRTVWCPSAIAPGRGAAPLSLRITG